MRIRTLAAIRATAQQHGWEIQNGPNGSGIYVRDEFTITVEFSHSGGITYAQRVEGSTARGFAFRFERDKRGIVLSWLTAARVAAVAS